MRRNHTWSHLRQVLQLGDSSPGHLLGLLARLMSETAGPNSLVCLSFRHELAADLSATCVPPRVFLACGRRDLSVSVVQCHFQLQRRPGCGEETVRPVEDPVSFF